MTSFTIVPSAGAISLSSRWKDAADFFPNEVVENNQRFRLIAKKELTLNPAERIFRVLLGIIIVAASVFFALLLLPVRQLFSLSKLTKCFAIPSSTQSPTSKKKAPSKKAAAPKTTPPPVKKPPPQIINTTPAVPPSPVQKPKPSPFATYTTAEQFTKAIEEAAQRHDYITVQAAYDCALKRDLIHADTFDAYIRVADKVPSFLNKKQAERQRFVWLAKWMKENNCHG